MHTNRHIVVPDISDEQNAIFIAVLASSDNQSYIFLLTACNQVDVTQRNAGFYYFCRLPKNIHREECSSDYVFLIPTPYINLKGADAIPYPHFPLLSKNVVFVNETTVLFFTSSSHLSPRHFNFLLYSSCS